METYLISRIRGTPLGSCFIFIPEEKKYPVLLISQVQDEKYIYNYCVRGELIKTLIKAIKKVFTLKGSIKLQIVKTSVYYLILKIEEINLYFKYRLIKYTQEV